MRKSDYYKILMFAPWFPPNRSSEANVTGKLVLAFLRRGWEIDVISQPVFSKVAISDIADIWGPLKEMTFQVPEKHLQGVHSFIMKAYAMLRLGHAIKGVTGAYYAYKKAQELLSQKRYDVILSRCQPSAGHLPAMRISNKYKIPWIANWNDIEPGIRAPEPYGKGLQAYGGLMNEHYIKQVANKATHHTFCSQRSAEYMEQWRHELKGNYTVIPHIALHHNNDRLNGTDTVFRLVHSGNFDGKRDPGPFLKALQLFLTDASRREHVEIILLGNEENDGKIKFKIPDDIKDRLKILPWCNYSESFRTLLQSSACLLIEAPLSNGIFLPGKFVDYIEARKPILALSPEEGTVTEIMTKHGGGIVVDCTDSGKIAESLELMYNSWDNNRLHSDYSSVNLYKNYSEDTIVSLYGELFEKIIPNSSGRR